MEFEAFVVIVAAVLILVILTAASGRRGVSRAQGRVCRTCGASHPMFAQYCRRCGQKL
jgi:ABC-type nitrate/sulfonate/bicarbonate transport system permease component